MNRLSLSETNVYSSFELRGCGSVGRGRCGRRRQDSAPVPSDAAVVAAVSAVDRDRHCVLCHLLFHVACDPVASALATPLYGGAHHDRRTLYAAGIARS